MIGEVDAIRALLTATGHVNFLGEVSGTPPANYYLIGISGGSPGVEQAIDGMRADIDDQVQVTSVAGSIAGVLIMQDLARNALTPGRMPRQLTVAGRHAVLVFDGSERLGVDRDVTNPTTNKHPAFGVDSYRLVSTPS